MIAVKAVSSANETGDNISTAPNAYVRIIPVGQVVCIITIDHVITTPINTFHRPLSPSFDIDFFQVTDASSLPPEAALAVAEAGQRPEEVPC